MARLPLSSVFRLATLSLADLFCWIEKNHPLEVNLVEEKKKWKKRTVSKPTLFSDTELLLIYEDFVLIRTLTENQKEFIAKNYTLEQQSVCIFLWSDEKHIIVLTCEEWTEQKKDYSAEALVLLKDKESVQLSINNFFNA